MVSEESDSLLGALVETLTRCSKLKLLIEGHTDTRGSAASNLNLSTRRAGAVLGELRKRGLTGSRMRSIGKGEAEPLNPAQTPEAHAQNRRIEFKLEGVQQ